MCNALTAAPGAARVGEGAERSSPRRTEETDAAAAVVEPTPAAATWRDRCGMELAILSAWGPVKIGPRYEWRLLVVPNPDAGETYGLPNYKPLPRVTVYQFRDRTAPADDPWAARWQDYYTWPGYDSNKRNGGLPDSLRTRLWDPNCGAIRAALNTPPNPEPETPTMTTTDAAPIDTPPTTLAEDSPAGPPAVAAQPEGPVESVRGNRVRITGRTLKALASCAFADVTRNHIPWARMLHIFDDERNEGGPSIRGSDGVFRDGPRVSFPVVCIEATDGRCALRLVFRDVERVGGRRFVSPGSFDGVKADTLLSLGAECLEVLDKSAWKRWRRPTDPAIVATIPFRATDPALVRGWEASASATEHPDPQAPRKPRRVDDVDAPERLDKNGFRLPQFKDAPDDPERMIGLGVGAGFGTVFAAIQMLGVDALRMDLGSAVSPIYLRGVGLSDRDFRGWDERGVTKFQVEACAMPVTL